METPNLAQPKIAGVIDFHYVKSHDFNTRYVDGFIGGPTPNRKVFFGGYLQRAAIPLCEGVEIQKDGGQGNVVRREGKTGIVREMQTAMVMDPETARLLAAWLTEQADRADNLGETS